MTRPPSRPATSETTTRCWASSAAAPWDSPGIENSAKPSTRGDSRGFRVIGRNTSDARYFVTPRPSRVIATPDTMWFTAKVTVATACSSPPSAPKTIPPSSAAHGPHW